MNPNQPSLSIPASKANLHRGHANLQKAHASLHGGQASLQRRQASLQKTHASLQRGQANMKKGDANLQSSHARLQKGDASLQRGHAHLHSACANTLCVRASVITNHPKVLGKTNTHRSSGGNCSLQNRYPSQDDAFRLHVSIQIHCQCVCRE